MPLSLLKRLLLATTFAAATVGALPAHAAYNGIVFFGDSLSDTGNIWYATGGFPPAPYYQGTSGAAPDRTGGQWSDYLGPSWPSVFAAKFGLLATPSVAGGNNYAWGGARTGVNPDATAAPWLDQQVDLYLGTGTPPSANALYSLMIGGNDVANNLLVPNVVPGIASIVTSLTDLYNAGGRQFLVANVADIGATPEFQGLGLDAAALASLRTVEWNLALDAALDSLTLPGASIGFLDLYSLGNDPALLAGYDNITDACLTATSLCADPTQYFYWDSFHPTSRTHASIAAFAAQAVSVPEPGTYLLFAAGLAALAWSSRKRAT
jgi:phospholipase/lecithinase/hemolysin